MCPAKKHGGRITSSGRCGASETGPAEDVDRQIDAVRARMARLRPSAFALAVDLLLADARLEPVEKRFVKQLAVKLNIQLGLANDLVRAMVIKNTA